jgi:DNA-binding transcriptional ArsR family regulator
VSGALADTGSARASADGLARLIGPNRARVLRLLDEPRSTTQLAALTALPLGAVSNHLRVLLEAGAVLRRRAGREVLYWRTSLGDALAASAQGWSPPSAVAARSGRLRSPGRRPSSASPMSARARARR